jgi:hypothetical protein
MNMDDFREPWVKLANGSELRDWGREDEIAYNQANRQARKYEFYVQAFDFFTDNKVKGDYYEFGCHRVRTFRMALTEARRHNLSDTNFYAFDSFAGLPEPETSPSVTMWKQGVLCTTEEQFWELVRAHGIYVDRCKTIKGFYQDSLSQERQQEFVCTGSKIAMVCVDCDLYESAIPVFKFIEPLLQEGSLIYIDDLFAGYKGSPAKGVARAFAEYQQSSRWKFVPHMQVGWWGRSYITYDS